MKGFSDSFIIGPNVRKCITKGLQKVDQFHYKHFYTTSCKFFFLERERERERERFTWQKYSGTSSEFKVRPSESSSRALLRDSPYGCGDVQVHLGSRIWFLFMSLVHWKFRELFSVGVRFPNIHTKKFVF